jgi:hypothetical protein
MADSRPTRRLSFTDRRHRSKQQIYSLLFGASDVYIGEHLRERHGLKGRS